MTYYIIRILRPPHFPLNDAISTEGIISNETSFLRFGVRDGKPVGYERTVFPDPSMATEIDNVSEAVRLLREARKSFKAQCLQCGEVIDHGSNGVHSLVSFSFIRLVIPTSMIVAERMMNP